MMSDEEALEMADRIVAELAGPTFVLRMARGMMGFEGDRRPSARRRAVKAARQIIDVINDHAFRPTAG